MSTSDTNLLIQAHALAANVASPRSFIGMGRKQLRREAELLSDQIIEHLYMSPRPLAHKAQPHEQKDPTQFT